MLLTSLPNIFELHSVLLNIVTEEFTLVKLTHLRVLPGYTLSNDIRHNITCTSIDEVKLPKLPALQAM